MSGKASCNVAQYIVMRMTIDPLVFTNYFLLVAKNSYLSQDKLRQYIVIH